MECQVSKRVLALLILITFIGLLMSLTLFLQISAAARVQAGTQKSILRDEDRIRQKVLSDGSRVIQFPDLVDVSADGVNDKNQITNQTTTISVRFDHKLVLDRKITSCQVVVMDDQMHVRGRGKMLKPWKPWFFLGSDPFRLYDKTIYFYTGSSLNRTPMVDTIKVNLADLDNKKPLYIGIAFDDGILLKKSENIYALAKFSAKPMNFKLQPSIDPLSVVSRFITGQGHANDWITNDVNDTKIRVGSDNRYSITLQPGDLNDRRDVVVRESNGDDEGTRTQKVSNPYVIQVERGQAEGKNLTLTTKELTELSQQTTSDDFAIKLQKLAGISVKDTANHNQTVDVKLQMEDDIDQSEGSKMAKYGSIVQELLNGKSKSLQVSFYGVHDSVKTPSYILTLFKENLPVGPVISAPLIVGQFSFAKQRVPLAEQLIAPREHPQIIMQRPNQSNYWRVEAQATPLTNTSEQTGVRLVFQDGTGRPPQLLGQKTIIYDRAMGTAAGTDGALDIAANWYDAHQKYPKGIYFEATSQVLKGTYGFQIKWQLDNTPA